MIRLRMKSGIAGEAWALGPGQEREFPDNEALRLIADGAAEQVLPPEAAGAYPDWPLKRITPQKYLRLYPTGPNAAKAREVLAGHAVMETR